MFQWSMATQSSRVPRSREAWSMSSRVKLRKLSQLAGIIGRDDEPEMMPVILRSVRQSSAVRLVSGRIE